MRARSIDILKAVCAFLIVGIHIPFPVPIGNYFIVLARIAVPIFFIISGYFYSDVVEQKREKLQIKKLFLLMVKANIIYLLWNLAITVLNKMEVTTFICRTFSLQSILKFLLLNVSPLSGHLWFLGAIIYVHIIILIADKRNARKLLYYSIILLLSIDLILGKYSIVLLHREFPYSMVRNFLFVGLPYFCIGCLLRQCDFYIEKLREEKLLLLIVLFSLTSILEHFILISVTMNATRDHYISTTLLAITLFILALKKKNAVFYGTNVILSNIGRKYSTGIYILHPIFIKIIEVFMRECGIYEYYCFIAPVVVYVITLLFLVFLTSIRETYHSIKGSRFGRSDNE